MTNDKDPTQDLDTLSSLSGSLNFTTTGPGLADVTVNIPATGSHESAGTNFKLWGDNNGAGWTQLQASATRPRTMTGSLAYTGSTTTAPAVFGVKVTFDRGGAASRKQNKASVAGTAPTLDLT